MHRRRFYDNIRLLLPRLRRHDAEPVVKELHQSDLRDAVTLSIGRIVGVSHRQMVIVIETGGAGIVVIRDQAFQQTMTGRSSRVCS